MSDDTDVVIRGVQSWWQRLQCLECISSKDSTARRLIIRGAPWESHQWRELGLECFIAIGDFLEPGFRLLHPRSRKFLSHRFWIEISCKRHADEQDRLGDWGFCSRNRLIKNNKTYHGCDEN